VNDAQTDDANAPLGARDVVRRAPQLDLTTAGVEQGIGGARIAIARLTDRAGIDERLSVGSQRDGTARGWPDGVILDDPLDEVIDRLQVVWPCRLSRTSIPLSATPASSASTTYMSSSCGAP
jgi:hypothetical protein